MSLHQRGILLPCHPIPTEKIKMELLFILNLSDHEFKQAECL